MISNSVVHMHMIYSLFAIIIYASGGVACRSGTKCFVVGIMVLQLQESSMGQSRTSVLSLA